MHVILFFYWAWNSIVLDAAFWNLGAENKPIECFSTCVYDTWYSCALEQFPIQIDRFMIA